MDDTDMWLQNRRRADAARRAIRQYTNFALEPEETLPTYTGDMLANIMHMCEHYNVDFEEALERGRMHYLAEKVILTD